MKLKTLIVAALFAGITATACSQKTASNTSAPATNAGSPAPANVPGPLPDKAFKAQITLADPPTKLRAGQEETIAVKVKNVSDGVWWARGAQFNNQPGIQFYIAVGNHWLDKEGKRLNEKEGHNGIPRDLKPGEEADMTLLITAPKTPGEFVLETDMVQEQVSWFGEKGSPTAKTKVTVVK